MAKKLNKNQIANLTHVHKKLGIALISLRAGSMSHMLGKISRRATTFLQTSLQSEVYTQNYEPPKLRESQFREFWNSNLGIQGQNDIWVLALWPSTKNTIRGKVMVSLSPGHGESCEFVFTHGSSMHEKCSNYALINLLFGLCKSVWIIDSLIIRPNPISKLQHTLLPPKCCEPRSTLQFFLLPLFSPLDLKLSSSRSLGMRHLTIITILMTSSLPLLNTLAYGKFCKVHCANMCTTNGKWVVNLFQSFDFIKTKVENISHLPHS